MVPMPILHLVGVVRMPRSIQLADRLILARIDIGVVGDQRDRRSGRPPLEYSREDLRPIPLTTRRCHLRLPHSPPIQVALHQLLVELQTGWAAVYNDTQCRPVRLSPSGDPERLAVGTPQPIPL